jgi:hypothetical protein
MRPPPSRLLSSLYVAIRDACPHGLQRSAARASIALIIVLVAPAACGSRRDPGVFDDLTSRLDRSGELTFTAEYRLGSGASTVVAQAQQPRRAAYVHPGGRSVATESELATCRDAGSGTRCTLTPRASAGADPALDLLSASTAEEPISPAPAGSGQPAAAMLTPTAALRLVSAAGQDGATVTRSDRVIAGEAATCVGVHGAGGFTLCVTARGILASFTGTAEGNLVTFELTRFGTTVDADAFTLPAGAAIDDRRQR